MRHKSGGITYLKKQGFAINEGGKYANIVWHWRKPRFFYVCVMGWRFYKWSGITYFGKGFHHSA